MSKIRIKQADLDLEAHQNGVVEMIDAYAADGMGNGMPLAPDVRRALLPGLQEHPTTLIFLAWDGERAVGIAVCFKGFSTFAARTLVHIEDFAVLSEYRGRGIGRRLLEAVEKKAVEMGCCKLTLQVQENNQRAREVYDAVGFARSEYVREAGGGLSLSKNL